MPVRAVAFELLIVKVSVDVPLTAMTAGANALPIEGGDAVVSARQLNAPNSMKTNDLYIFMIKL